MATANTITDNRWIATSTRRLAYVLIGSALFLSALFALNSFRESRRLFIQSAIHESRLSQLRLALIYYFEDHQGSFASQSSIPPVSWRVKVLPMIEQRPLFEQYHLDQAWNSNANFSLQHFCPKFYTSDPAQECSDILLVTSGDSDEEPVAANALLLAIDSKIFNVPWTRPHDITFQELDSTLRKMIRLRQLANSTEVWIAFPAQRHVKHQRITLNQLLRRIESEVNP